jgi:hypothetical protein
MVVHNTTWKRVDCCCPNTHLHLWYSFPFSQEVVAIVSRGRRLHDSSPDVSLPWCSKYDWMYPHTWRSRQLRYTGPRSQWPVVHAQMTCPVHTQMTCPVHTHMTCPVHTHVTCPWHTHVTCPVTTKVQRKLAHFLWSTVQVLSSVCRCRIPDTICHQ